MRDLQNSCQDHQLSKDLGTIEFSLRLFLYAVNGLYLWVMLVNAFTFLFQVGIKKMGLAVKNEIKWRVVHIPGPFCWPSRLCSWSALWFSESSQPHGSRPALCLLPHQQPQGPPVKTQVGRVGGRRGREEKWEYMYMYSWFPLLYSRN